MGLYEGIKDVAKVVQQADNVELYRKLLDLGAQALDLQEENMKLREEITLLRKRQDISENIVRHKESFLTLENDQGGLRYCTHCWDSSEKLVQLQCDEHDATFACPHCHMSGVFDEARNKSAEQEALDEIRGTCTGGGNPYNRYLSW